MSVIIMHKERELLRSSNIIFRGFYKSIIDYIEKNNIEFNKNLTELIEDLEAGCRGIGLDIGDYISEESEFVSFLDLIRKSLNDLYVNIPDLALDYKKLFENFYQGLIEVQRDFSE